MEPTASQNNPTYDLAPASSPPQRRPALPRSIDVQASELPVAVIGQWHRADYREIVWPILILISAAIGIFCLTAVASARFATVPAAARFLLVTGLIRVPLLIGAVWATVPLCDLELGRLRDAVLRLAAIAMAAPLAISVAVFVGWAVGGWSDAALSDPFAGHVLGMIAAGLLSLGVYAALFYWLFQLPQDVDALRFVLIVWVVQLFLGGLVVHMLCDPPPPSPHYVPDGSFHFVWGN